MSKKTDQDNRSNQLNPNNDSFHQSRGQDGAPKPAQQGSGGSTPAPAPKQPASPAKK